MKKILFATTALVATASVAAADVTFSGYGRFGAASDFDLGENAAISGGATPGTATGNSGIYSRIRLQIDMTTEADNGLEFGARLRYEATSFDGANTRNLGSFNAARFYARAGGFELGVGNTIGAIEAMPGIYMSTQSSGIGLSGLGFTNLVTNTNAFGSFGWDAYSSGGTGAAANNGVEVMYSMGDFGAHLSHSSSTLGVDRTALQVNYSFNDWTVAAAYQESDLVNNDKAVLTVGGRVGPANVSLAYADNDGIGKFGIYANVDVGAATRVDAFVTSEDGVAGGETYGLGVSHSLGGGASLEAGVVNNSTGANDSTAYDLGIRFNF